MLIKEYRIPLPLSVEEYRIAQLYMIQKKSREESRGTDSGVEIIENKPYTDGPGGNGQYTYKIYHIGSHLPGWFQAILPKSALRVEEEAWNAYPYTKTRYRCPFVEKFLLEIETRYLSDCCEEDNVFDMKKSELSQRQVDIIDIVRDPISSGDYRKEEDPKLFLSSKTNRGPLAETWRDEYLRATKGDKSVMTAYKLCRVEFKYWGMQNKIERFIHDIALRRTMLRAHRQAWSWQDEYYGLTMDDIRRLERETQLHLAHKMAASKAADGEPGEVTPVATTPTNSAVPPTGARPSKGENSVQFADSGRRESGGKGEVTRDYSRSVSLESYSSTSTVINGGKAVRQTRICPSGGGKEVGVGEWRYQSLEQLQESDSSQEEYFDAMLPQEDADGDGERWEEEGGGGGEGEGDGGGGGGGGGRHLGRSSSMEMISSGDEYQDAMTPASSDSHIVEDSESPFGRRVDMFRQMYSVDHSLPSGGADSQPSSADVCPVKVLFIVLHGGSILDSGQQGASSKRNDFATLQSTFESVLQSHYHAAAHHIALRLVHCPHVCTDTLGILSSLSPYSYNSQASEDGNIAATQDFVPLGAIALFATSSAEYQEYVNAMVCRANAVYREFLHSSDGRGFSGQVCLLADSTGSLLSYDALTRCHSPFMRVGSRYGSRDSMDALQDDAIKVNHPDGLDPDHSDPVLCNLDLQSSDPVASAQSRYRIERSRSEVSPPKNSDLMRTDSTRPRSQRNSARLSTSMSERDPSRRTSSGSNFDGGFAQFDFEVSELFMFGSPLALVLAYRRVFSGEDRQSPPVRPACHQVYNLFHSSDPMAVRLEPLLNDCFKYVAPVKVARYSKFPLGDGEPVHVVETVQSNIKLFTESPRSSNSPAHPVLQRQLSSTSINSTTSGVGENTVSAITGVTCKWWGTKRMDYVLYCPDILHSFPSSALAPLFHSSFWESADAAAFILRQVLRHEVTVDEGAERGVSRTASFKMTQPREKWRKRRTTIKVRNLQQNHRANDVIVLEDKPQTLHARFMYGSLDIVTLSGEKVDINVMTQPSSGDWVHVGTGITDSHGRLTFTLDDSQRLSHGMYPVKCVVRGDHTSVDCFLTVLPPKTETVVFSIDGSFTASVSIMGKDPKVRAGAVDVVRHWQDLGYLILYVSARPDMQHRKVVAWLAQHNFPHGMVAFMDGLSKDPLRQKLHYLKHLYTEVDIKYVAAYGSSKDVTIYRELGLQAPQIFIVGKASKKQAAQAQVVSDGYAAHLNNLLDPGALRPATGNARLFLRKSCFRLPVASDAKKTAKRTVSYPGSSSKGGDFLRLPDAGPGPTKIIVPDIAAGEEDSYGGGAARARGMSPMVVKNSGSKTTTV